MENLNNLNDLTSEEKDYFELLIDFLGNGDISESERNILNKRKEKFGISDSRAKELEEFAKQERLSNLKPQNDSEIEYYELIFDFLGNGNISESERNILNKRKEKFGISDSRAKELEEFAKNEYLESKKIKFETEGEKDYYEFLVDMLEDGTIDERERNILNKRKEKYGISEARAKELEEFAKLNNSGDNSNSLLEEGEAYFYRGEYGKAIEIFKKAVELNPNNDNNWKWLGRSYNLNGQKSEAIEPLKRAIELNPNNADNWDSLASFYNGIEEYNKTIETYKRAIELNPNGNYNWNFNLSLFYEGELNKAIEVLKRAVELNSNSDNNWHWLGASYFGNGQYLDAINSLKKAIELNPNNADSWYWLGRSYGCNEQFLESINPLKKAVELNPDDEDNWYFLGLSYYFNKQYLDAINPLKKAIELNPNNADNWYCLGLSYHLTEQYSEAEECYRKCLQINPNHEVARELLENLQSANYGISGKSIVSGISKGIDTANELASKVKPETIETITKVGGAAVTAATILGAFFNRNKN